MDHPKPERPPVDHRAIIDAVAPLLGLAIEPEWRDAVIANLAATARAAELVLALPLDDEVEPAPVFRA